MDENFCFDLQVRLALGYRQLGAGHFELRTMYNFRQRLSEYMQRTGEDLVAQAFAQVTAEQVAAFALKTSKLRMDSTQIASNIRQYSRLQLLVEVLQRVYRDLSEAAQQHYAAEFAAYVKGSSGQYLYRLKPEAYASQLC
jgi:ABC-type transporter MlaC component